MIEHPIVLRRLTVAAVIDLTPRMRRLTLTGAQLGGFVSDNGQQCGPFVTASPDDHVKVFPPAPDGGATVLPEQSEGHLHWPDDPPAVARDYTVRRFDPIGGTLDIDVLLHGHGPGSHWAATAGVGDDVHVAGPRASLQHRVDAPALLLVGDDTALPAIARFLDELDDPEVATVVVAAHADNHAYPLRAAKVTWVAIEDGAEQAVVLAEQVLASGIDADRDPDLVVWVACEYSAARHLRSVLREQLSMPRERVFVTHYWRANEATDGGPASDPDARLRAMADLTTPWALRVAATLRLADVIDDGTTTHDAIAGCCGADVGAIEILLDYLVARRVFTKAPDGRYGLDELGELLLDDSPDSWRAELDLGGASARMDTAIAGLAHSVHTGEPGYPLVHGRPFWDDMSADEDVGADFDRQLAGWARHWSAAVVTDPLWSSAAQVIDVGGGTGTLAAALLEAFEHLHVTVVELPASAQRARDNLASAGTRASIVEGSFFEPLHASGDTFVLAQVLHDWKDDQAVSILRNCANAAGPDGRVVIVERLPATDSNDLEHVDMSMLMLVLFGAKERSLDQYRQLAAAAGLTITAARPAGEGMWIMVCGPADG